MYEDRSFTFVLKTPPASELIKAAAGIKAGSGTPQAKKVGSITQDQLKEIAATKLPDLNCTSVSGRSRGREASRVARGGRRASASMWPFGPAD